MTPTEALASLGLTVTAEFVPFSLSRNNGKTKGKEKFLSLNWNVTALRNGREILKTEYSAGIGHCPGMKKPVPSTWDRPNRFWFSSISEWEIENGYEASWMRFTGFSAMRRAATEEEMNDGKRDRVRKAILPKTEDVFYSLINDIVEEPFEDWCANFGYSDDSIDAKRLYDLCVDHTMRLRSAIGDAGIETLRAAFQDY